MTFILSSVLFLSSLIPAAGIAATISYDFELIGWYEKFKEPGFKGDKSFSISGSTAYQYTPITGIESLQVNSKTQLTARSESVYWRLPDSKINCLVHQRLQLLGDDLSFAPAEISDKNCGPQEKVMRHIHTMLFALHQSAKSGRPGPHHIEGGFLWKRFDSEEGDLIFTTHVRKKDRSLEEIDFSGELKFHGTTIPVRGRSTVRADDKSIKKLGASFEYPQATDFPADTDRLTLLEIRVDFKGSN